MHTCTHACGRASCGSSLARRAQEWDGLVRIGFLRKNETLGACFRTTTVLQALEKNYRTMCALLGKVRQRRSPSRGPASCSRHRRLTRPRQAVPEDFKIEDTVTSLLKSVDADGKRARSMSIDDFLVCVHARPLACPLTPSADTNAAAHSVLRAFTEFGIRFS